MENHWILCTAPWDEPEHKCRHCEKPMYDDKQYCSDDCFRADMM